MTKSKRKSNIKLFWSFSCFLIVFLCVFYVFQNIQATQESYSILNNENKIKEITQENYNLEINLTENNSIKDIDELASSMSYKKTGRVYYIQLFNSIVAVK